MEEKLVKKNNLVAQKRRVNLRIVNKWLTIPAVLLIFWLFAALLANPHESFTVIDKPHYWSSLESIPGNHSVYKGQSVSANFIADDNNLGIILLKHTSRRVHHTELEDYLKFEIYNNEELLYSRISKIGHIKMGDFLVFGFPKIQNSKGESYRFKVTSLYGNEQNLVSIPKNLIFFHAKYQIDKKDIVASHTSIVNFVMDKLFGFVLNDDSLRSTNIYLIPFFLYVAWIIFLKKAVLNKSLFSLLVLFLLVTDVFLIEKTIEIIVIGIVDLWIIAIIRNRYSSKRTLLIAAMLFLATFPFVLINKITIVDKMSSWSYMFLLIGCLQLLINEKFKSKKHKK